MQQLSKTLSSEHLIQGQWQDLFDRPQTFSDLTLIHQRKTGDLFSFVLSCVSNLKPNISPKMFYTMGQELGLAFQIQDDLYDKSGQFTTLGKLASSDDQSKGVLQFLSVSDAVEQISLLKQSISKTLSALDLSNSLLAKLIFGKILTK